MVILLQFMKSSPPEQALQYFERAADSGNAVAMAFLGKYFAEKKSVATEGIENQLSLGHFHVIIYILLCIILYF